MVILSNFYIWWKGSTPCMYWELAPSQMKAGGKKPRTAFWNNVVTQLFRVEYKCFELTRTFNYLITKNWFLEVGILANLHSGSGTKVLYGTSWHYWVSAGPRRLWIVPWNCSQQRAVENCRSLTNISIWQTVCEVGLISFEINGIVALSNAVQWSSDTSKHPNITVNEPGQEMENSAVLILLWMTMWYTYTTICIYMWSLLLVWFLNVNK